MGAASGRGRSPGYAIGAASVLLAATAVVGCTGPSGGTGPGAWTSPTPAAAPETSHPDRPIESPEALGAELAAALRRAGHGEIATAVERGETRLSRAPAGPLRTWQVIGIELTRTAFPDRILVGFDGNRVVMLTGSGPRRFDPKAFNRVIAADPGTVGSTRQAAELVRWYLEIVRPRLEVLDTIEDLDFLPDLPADDRRRRDEFVRTYRDVVRPPTARVAGGRYVVTAYVRDGMDVRRHTLTVAASGRVEEEGRVLAGDLPLNVLVRPASRVGAAGVHGSVTRARK